MAPAGAVTGPLSSDALPQIFAGGALGHDPFGTGRAVVELVGLVVAVGGGAVVVVGALVSVGGSVVGGLVVGGLIVGPGAVVVGAVVVAGAVLVGGAVVGAGAVVVGAEVAVAVGAAVGVGVVPLLAILNFALRLDLVPSDHVSTTRMRCDPSASFEVSYGSAVPLRAVPARSKGGLVTVRTGGVVRAERSR
ncbi:MAG TPA: hypothetical protein VI074_04230 [Propionibacteriaceae bacterium]